jgi:hypothetical protein
MLLIAAGDHPGRLRSEAAWAHLCAAAPIPASSGKVTRQANHALWRIVITRMGSHPPTRASVARRSNEGSSKPEIIRCLKRLPGTCGRATRSWCSPGCTCRPGDELSTHPQGDMSQPLTGVFSTCSPNRPNSIGLHHARIVARDGLRIELDALEAIDGTPVVDVKPAIDPPA